MKTRYRRMKLISNEQDIVTDEHYSDLLALSVSDEETEKVIRNFVPLSEAMQNVRA